MLGSLLALSGAPAGVRRGAPRRRSFALCAGFAIAALSSLWPTAARSSAVEVGVRPPSWTHVFKNGISWMQTPLPGIVIVDTKAGLFGLDALDGSVRWEREFRNLSGCALDRIPGTHLAVLSLGKKSGARQPSFAVIDLWTGREMWNSQALGFGECMGQFALPPVRGLFVHAKTSDDKKTTATLDLVTGALLWRQDKFLEGWKPERGVDGDCGPVLAGNPPLFDTDSTMVVLWDAASLRKYDARNGTLLWAAKPPKAKESMRFGTRPSRRVAAAMLAPGDSVLYAPYDNTLCAFRVADGKPLWKKPPTLDGVVTQLALERDLIVVRVEFPESVRGFGVSHGPIRATRDIGEDEWFRAHWICLVDRRDGRLLKEFGESWVSQGSPSRQFSNFLVLGDTVYVARNGALRLIDLNKREEIVSVPLDVKSEPGSSDWTLSVVDSQLVIAGGQNLWRFSRDGRLLGSAHFRPVRRTALDLGTLILGSILEAAVNSDHFSVDIGDWAPVIAEPVSKTQHADECTVFMTHVDSDTLKGTAFERVRLRDGAVMSRVGIPEEFDNCRVTRDGRCILLKTANVLTAYRLE